MNTSIIKMVLAISLLLYLFNMPYTYYQFVRFVAMIGFDFLAFTAYEQNNKNETFIFIALALLFQPFIKIAIGSSKVPLFH